MAVRSITVRAMRPTKASPFTNGAPTFHTLANRSFKLSPDDDDDDDDDDDVVLVGKAR